MPRSLFDQRMLPAMRGFYRSKCTIQANVPTVDDLGQPVEAWTAAVTGLRDLPCSIAPFTGQVNMSEARRVGQILDVEEHHVALPGAYPEILVTMRAVVDGVAWQIIGVDIDSHRETTRLRVQRIT